MRKLRKRLLLLVVVQRGLLLLLLLLVLMLQLLLLVHFVKLRLLHCNDHKASATMTYFSVQLDSSCCRPELNGRARGAQLAAPVQTRK